MKIAFEKEKIDERTLLHTWNWLIQTKLDINNAVYQLNEICILDLPYTRAPEIPDATLSNSFIEDTCQCQECKIDSFFKPPNYKLELVYKTKGANGQHFMKELSLIDGCPSKSYEDQLEVDQIPMMRLAIQLRELACSRKYYRNNNFKNIGLLYNLPSVPETSEVPRKSRKNANSDGEPKDKHVEVALKAKKKAKKILEDMLVISVTTPLIGFLI